MLYGFIPGSGERFADRNRSVTTVNAINNPRNQLFRLRIIRAVLKYRLPTPRQCHRKVYMADK